jgi:hypothetical protein
MKILAVFGFPRCMPSGSTAAKNVALEDVTMTGVSGVIIGNKDDIGVEFECTHASS